MQTHDLTYGKNTPELSFTGGKVHTVNARNDIVEAVVIGDGRILAVGSTAIFAPSTAIVRARWRYVGVRCFLASSTRTAT
jgi:predicted amidohydrolase YtcJ